MIDIDNVVAECGCLVTIIRSLENNMELDPFVGYMDGINSVLQNKSGCSRNLICYEKYCRRNVYNCGFISAPLALYYLKQETDFNNWFVQEKWAKSVNGHACNSIYKSCTEVLMK